MDFKILFEDADLIAFDKPAGLPSQPTRDRKRPDLYTQAQEFLQTRDSNKNFYLGLHHRLDVGTSGVIVFTKQKSINKAFQDLFREKRIQKTYLALSYPPSYPDKSTSSKSWTIKNYLGPHPQSNAKKTWYTEVKSGGDLAITDFKLIEENAKSLLVEAKPVTGRTHQIRVHLLQSGIPIVGDRLYFLKENPKSIEAPRLFLHAARIEFIHPRTKKSIEIQSALPKEFSTYLK